MLISEKVDYKTDIDEFEFKRTPETDAMLKQLCIKECFVRCKDCKYWNKHHLVDIYVCSIHNKEGQYPYLLFEMTADDFCSRGERKDG